MVKGLVIFFVAMHFVLPIVLIGWPGSPAATVAKGVWIALYVPVFAAMAYLLYRTAGMLGLLWSTVLTGRQFPDPRDTAVAWASLSVTVALVLVVVAMLLVA